MNLLFVASECAPFVKTGGLADVIGSIPQALADLGDSVQVLMPGYPALKDYSQQGTTVHKFDMLCGGPARVVAVETPTVRLLVLEAAHLFDRPGSIYLDANQQDWSDNHLRYGALCQAAAFLATTGINGWKPDVVSAHDWQAGLVPAYLKQHETAAPPVVMTVHNIAFQGVFSSDTLGALGLQSSLFTPAGIEYYGDLSFMKAGLALSDKITTVSPTYSRELMTPEFGMGFEGLLQHRRADVLGILNGIDLVVWNPETDPFLDANYSIGTLTKKSENREALIKRFGLSTTAPGPLFCVVSRLTEQKGLDLLLACLPQLVDQGAQLAVLGTGDKKLEKAFSDAGDQFPGSVSAILDYDEGLSHQLQGGSDAILVPSRFEPCGLTQLYGLRYGTLPVVSRTGGLADTVIDANEAAIAAGHATGIQHQPDSEEALAHAIARTCSLYKNKTTWDACQKNAMRQDVGWAGSARLYRSMFQSLDNV